jgi:hypothetical protein
MPFRRRCRTGRTAPSNLCSRSIFLTLCGSKSATQKAVRLKMSLVVAIASRPGANAVLCGHGRSARRRTRGSGAVDCQQRGGQVLAPGDEQFAQPGSGGRPSPCIVHLVRHSLTFCGWKDRKNVARDLKRVYQATDDIEAEKALADFEAERGQNIRPSRPHGGGPGKR